MPCRTVNECDFFPSGICVFVFLGYLGLKASQVSSEKINVRKGLGRGTLNTCSKFQGLISQKRRVIWTFVR